MSTIEERIEFPLCVVAWDKEGYKRKQEFVAELRTAPGLEVSDYLAKAGNDGSEFWLITIISSVANIATIVEFIYKFIRKKRKKTEGELKLIAGEDDKDVISENMTRREIKKLIETRSSYALLGKPILEKVNSKLEDNLVITQTAKKKGKRKVATKKTR